MAHINIEATLDNIKTAMVTNNCSAKQLSEILCITQQSVYKWFERKGLPTIDNLATIAHTFNMTLDDIISVN